jgi:hypothetical protein
MLPAATPVVLSTAAVNLTHFLCPDHDATIPCRYKAHTRMFAHLKRDMREANLVGHAVKPSCWETPAGMDLLERVGKGFTVANSHPSI